MQLVNLGPVLSGPRNPDYRSPLFYIPAPILVWDVYKRQVGGKFLDMLANIDAISSDYREEPGMIMPTLRIQDVLVAGGK